MKNNKLGIINSYYNSYNLDQPYSLSIANALEANIDHNIKSHRDCLKITILTVLLKVNIHGNTCTPWKSINAVKSTLLMIDMHHTHLPRSKRSHR